MRVEITNKRNCGLLSATYSDFVAIRATLHSSQRNKQAIRQKNSHFFNSNKINMGY